MTVTPEQRRNSGLYSWKLLTQSNIRNQYGLCGCERFHLVRADFQPIGLSLTLLLVSIFCKANKLQRVIVALDQCSPSFLVFLFHSLPLLVHRHFSRSPLCQSHLAHLTPFSHWSNPLILTSTTHPGILLHLKQTHTLWSCATVSSHLLFWHCTHTCRLTTSSHCMLILARPRAHPHKHTHTQCPGIL